MAVGINLQQLVLVYERCGCIVINPEWLTCQTLEEAREIEILLTEWNTETINNLRSLRITDRHLIQWWNLTITIHIVVLDITGDIITEVLIRWVSNLNIVNEQVLGQVTPSLAQRIAYTAQPWRIIVTRLLINKILTCWIGEVTTSLNPPSAGERLIYVQRHIDTLTLGLTDIRAGSGHKTHTRGHILTIHQDILTLLVVVLHLQLDCIEKFQLKSDITLLWNLPCNLVVGITAQRDTVYCITVGCGAEYIFIWAIIHINLWKIEETWATNSIVTNQTISTLNLQLRDDLLQALSPIRLVRHHPTKTCWWEETPTVISRETLWTVVSEVCLKEIAVVVAISCTTWKA